MKNGFLVFDVETPNNRQDKICQIGLVRHVSNAKPPECSCYFINPDAPFDSICCDIHGISAKDVKNEPTFDELWKRELSELFSDSVLIAHNASFDLSVLYKTLDFYHLKMPEIQYVDTYDLSRKHYPSLPDHKLKTVASFLGHTITHSHDALSDAYAAYIILIETLKRFGNSALSIKRYQAVANTMSASANKRVLINELNEILTLIASDATITFGEAWLLYDWLNSYQNFIPEGLFYEFADVLVGIMVNGEIKQHEEDYLLKTIYKIISPTQVIDGVIFQDKSFVLTGDFLFGTKQEVTDFIQGKGGIVKRSVSKTIDYVVIGNYGSDRYTHGTYGTKVTKAMSLQDQGSTIMIIQEDELFPKGK